MLNVVPLGMVNIDLSIKASWLVVQTTRLIRSGAGNFLEPGDGRTYFIVSQSRDNVRRNSSSIMIFILLSFTPRPGQTRKWFLQNRSPVRDGEEGCVGPKRVFLSGRNLLLQLQYA